VISINDVQKAILSILKTDASLLAEIGAASDIKEDYWPGSDWSYPAIRIAINSAIPASVGSCHLTLWDVGFSIFAFTQPTSIGSPFITQSSYECSNLMALIAQALFGMRVTGDDFVPVTAVGILGQNPPVPEPPPAGWRGEILFSMQIKEG